MATPIPGFATQVISSGETVQVNGGSPAELESTRWYYFVSNRSTESNGQSLLNELKQILDALSSGLATTWTVTLAKQASTGVYKINISHNHASSRTITFSSGFHTALGFASTSVVVATATTVVADYQSYWWWTPNMPISLAGPESFDPAFGYGVPVSAGVAQRAPDGVTAYVHNGTLYEAEYMFQLVEPIYLIRNMSGNSATYTNRDLETWWKQGPAQGRRVLMWRDRDNATGSNAPSEGAASPYNYIEYAPQQSLMVRLPAKPTTQYTLRNWDVKLDFWVTENGETPLSD
jgi:hypothetical protein